MSKNYGVSKYLYKLAIALDQLFNVILCGWPNETLSSRTYRSAHLVSHVKKRWIITEKIINALFFWQKSHCKSAYETELARKHSPQ